MLHRAATFLATVLMLQLALSSVTAQQVPSAVTYQGKLTDLGGVPVPDGTYQVQFKLYDVSTGGTFFWNSPLVNVDTKKGLFTTQIGVITPADLAGKTDLWLEIWAGNPFAALTPRVNLVSVPFALRAGDLTLPFAGSTSAAAGAAFSITNTLATAISGITSGATSRPAAEFMVTDTGCSGEAVYAETVGSGSAVKGKVTTAGTGSAGYFQCANTSSSAPAVYAYAAGPGHGVYGTSVNGSAGYFEIANLSSTTPALYARTDGGGAAIHGYTSGGGKAGVFEIFNGANNSDVLAATTNGDGNAVRGSSAGGRAGYFHIDVGTNSSPALEATTKGLGNVARFENTNAVNSAPAVYARTNAGGKTIHSIQTANGYAGYFENASGATEYPALYAQVSGSNDAIEGRNIVSGNYGRVGTYAYGVHGHAPGNIGRGVYGVSEGAHGYGVYAQATGSDAYGVYALATGTSGVGIYAEGGGAGIAAIFKGNLVIQDPSSGGTVMELGVGLDYAEGFDLRDDSEVAPGTVLVIDPENPGKLAVSAKPYDRKVAGIVAGAKDLKSGVRLGAGQYDRDVALAGRVYCSVDATNASVEPGDLLTTSATPGYAMKVTDYSRAQGAVLGKAMERLEKGRLGQILVLVTLQ